MSHNCYIAVAELQLRISFGRMSSPLVDDRLLEAGRSALRRYGYQRATVERIAGEANLELLVALQAHTDAVFHEEGEQPLTRSVFTEPLERLLRDGAADGSLRDVDPVEMATVLFNLVGWTYIHLR